MSDIIFIMPLSANVVVSDSGVGYIQYIHNNTINLIQCNDHLLMNSIVWYNNISYILWYKMKVFTLLWNAVSL